MSGPGLPASLHEIARLRAALRPLDALPADTCWNRDELDGLLLPATELADAAVLVGLVARASGTAVVLTRRSRIDIDDLPPEVGLAVPDALVATDIRPLADVEREYIKSVLRAVDGNRSQAARRLGIGEATLYRKIKKFGET